MLFSGLLIGCSSNAEKSTVGNACLDSKTCELESENTPMEINIDKLEIYHFHATNQCYSCITVGNYAKETLDTFFKTELDSGIIIFDHVNLDLFENKDLVFKYGVTGSSLWIGTYTGDNFKTEENILVWYKIKNKNDYMTYLKSVIEQKLAGN